MGKVNRLLNRIEPFAVLFWGLGIVGTCTNAHILLQVTQPAGLVSLNHSTVRHWKVRFNLQKKRRPPSFSHLDVLFIYDVYVFKNLTFQFFASLYFYFQAPVCALHHRVGSHTQIVILSCILTQVSIEVSIPVLILRL